APCRSRGRLVAILRPRVDTRHAILHSPTAGGACAYNVVALVLRHPVPLIGEDVAASWEPDAQLLTKFYRIDRPLSRWLLVRSICSASARSPASASRPFSITKTRVTPIASRKARSWETTIIGPVYATSAASIRSWEMGSRWLVGSSRSSSVAPAPTSRARASVILSPQPK